MKNNKNDVSKAENFETSKIKFFKKQSASDWMDEAKSLPELKKIFGELWYQGEISFLYADTNTGKSILAVQIAEMVTKGLSFGPLENEIEPLKLLYFDFELTVKQFEHRYIDGDKRHNFSDLFDRVEFDPHMELEDDQTLEQAVTNEIEKLVVEGGYKYLIIDNYTYLASEMEKGKNSIPLMRSLKEIKNQHGLSILILGHTKKRDNKVKISSDDLSGSKALMNFCDSAFAIGKSEKDPNLRYIKQMKVRNSALLYGDDNVLLCAIEKQDGFLGFRFIEFSTEKENLKENGGPTKEMMQQAIEMYKENIPYREIAEKLGKSKSTVCNWIKKYKLQKEEDSVQSVHLQSRVTELDKNQNEEKKNELPF